MKTKLLLAGLFDLIGTALLSNPSDLDSTVHRWLNPVAKLVIDVQ